MLGDVIWRVCVCVCDYLCVCVCVRVVVVVRNQQMTSPLCRECVFALCLECRPVKVSE